MTAGKESRTAHSVAIAQSLAQSDIDALLASSALWDAPDRVSVKSVTGQTPEDFSHNRRFSVCFLPSGVGREWLGGLTRLDCDTFVECSSEIDFADLAPLIPTNGGLYVNAQCLSPSCRAQIRDRPAPSWPDR